MPRRKVITIEKTKGTKRIKLSTLNNLHNLDSAARKKQAWKEVCKAVKRGDCCETDFT